MDGMTDGIHSLFYINPGGKSRRELRLHRPMPRPLQPTCHRLISDHPTEPAMRADGNIMEDLLFTDASQTEYGRH